jgi:hypothetical protein
MTGLAIIALLAFVAALVLHYLSPSVGPAFVHAIMAIGVMPLIMGAMIYFTPVLTHSRAAPWHILMVPLLALLAGLLVTASLLGRRELLPVPAALAFLAVSVLLGWMWMRARAMLGHPHPGFEWYRWALICLLLGLMAISIALIQPASWTAWRRFHLHINLLGFVGLTAYGTLRVLVPTVAGYADPDARTRLRSDLYLAVVGSLLVAAGSAWLTWLVWPGLVLWLIPLLRFASSIVLRWRKQVWGWHRAGASLGAAIFGLIVVLLTAGFHAVGVASPASILSMFFFAFLFPLVTGAVSYLLPVWLFPARTTSAYEKTARVLAWGSGARSLVFLAAAAMAWLSPLWAIYLALIGVVAFLLPVSWALWTGFGARR